MATNDSDTDKDEKKVVIPNLNGRVVLFTVEEKVDGRNIVQVLRDVLPLYSKNKSDILYLQAYRRGVQPILYREKKVRAEIKNVVVKNIANEIVNFKTGYLLGEPIQYVPRDRAEDESIQVALDELNNFCYINKKSNEDKELADDMYTCGTAYRMVLPNTNYNTDKQNEAPFSIYTINPATCSVVYSTGLGHKPVFSFQEIYVKDPNKTNATISKYCCYTATKYFEIVNNKIVSEKPNPLGRIPLIEYPLNSQRMGAFEPVITLLDAINKIESNRVDAVEQAVQAIMVFYNLGMDTDAINYLKEEGAISLTSSDASGIHQDVKYINCDLNQTETQTLVDSLEQDILTLCGMPNRSGGYSTSDTGTAVIMRDGWSDTEARAKQDELMFIASEIDFLKTALYITYTTQKVDGPLSIANIDIKFTRKNYENMAQKTDVLIKMLQCDKIDPQLAFTCSGIFSDPQLAYRQSKEHYDKLVLEGQIDQQEPTSTEEIIVDEE